MSTDARCELLVDDPRAGFASPRRWADIHLGRDYALFDLLGGGRSGDPADAVVPVRPVRWPGCEAPDPHSTWLFAHELEQVVEAYRRVQSARGHGDASLRELRAIMEAMKALNDGAPERTRLLIRFF